MMSASPPTRRGSGRGLGGQAVGPTTPRAAATARGPPRGEVNSRGANIFISPVLACRSINDAIEVFRVDQEIVRGVAVVVI